MSFVNDELVGDGDNEKELLVKEDPSQINAAIFYSVTSTQKGRKIETFR